MPFNITIAIPSRDMIHANFAFSLISLIMQTGFPVHISNIRSSILPVSRSMLVEKAQSNKSDYIMFLDSDMVFPPSTIKTLLSHDKDIVAATYCQREGSSHPMGCTVDDKPLPLTGLIEAGRLPTGCMLIKMSVFEKMQKPYFRWAFRDNNSRIIGEDVEFCDRARDLGFSIWCDMDLSKSVGHIGEVIRFIGN